MLDHISLPVSDLARGASFYDAVLAPLGFVRVFENARFIGYAPPGEHDEPFAIRPATNVIVPAPEMHIAFVAASREAVCAFHAAAIEHGARSDGEPALYPDYGQNYFAAFVIDLDGYRIEAVHHGEPYDAT